MKPEQERLMHHRGEQAICCVVTRDIEDGDARLMLCTIQGDSRFISAFRRRLPDSRVKIVSLLEIDVDDVVSTYGSVERYRPAIDFDSLEGLESRRARA